MRPPNVIGRYRINRRVGAGGMGIVYEAVDTRDGKRVALKVLLPHAAEEAEGLLRFKREFRALARLRHPNIVRVYDAGIEDDTPFIAMEYLVGKDARTYLRSFPEGPARDRELIRVLRQILGALAHIHARRIVHRDLKPENILVTPEGRLKLMDFGVARLLRMPTSSSGLLGTFAYMAPEQVTTGEIDGRSDLYAVGVFIYEILAGRYPFPVEPPAAALHHHVNTPPELIQHHNPKADAQLAKMGHRLLEKDPLDRFQSAEEALVALNEIAPRTGSSPEISIALPSQLFVPRFVAREDNLEQLEGVASDAAGGRGRLVLIEGPSGVGKSRLLEEVRLRIRRRAHVLVGQCSPEMIQAYGAFQPVLDGVAQIASRAPAEVVARIVGRDAALVAGLSPRLASLGGPLTTDHLDPMERRIRLHKAVVGVIGRLALTKAVVIFIEDIHWADLLTLELLWDATRTLLAPRPGGSLHETICPVSLVMSRRSLAEGPDQSEALIRRLEERGNLERLNVEPLNDRDIAEMVRTMTGVAHIAPAVIEELVTLTHGIPLMVQEIIHAWLNEGELRRTRNVWTFRGEPLEARGPALRSSAPPPPQDEASSTSPGRPAPLIDGDPTPIALPVPPPRDTDPPTEGRTEEGPTDRGGLAAQRSGSSVDESGKRQSGKPRRSGHDDLVLGKLKKLSENARELVERLALLGRLLPADLVSALAGVEEDSLLDAIDELVRSDVLVEDVSGTGVRYHFYHDDFRDAVSRGIPKDRREALHLFLAQTLERRFKERRKELAHVLARHFRNGGQPERAVRYLMISAQSAAARGDLDGAMRRIDDALATIDEGPATPATATRRSRCVIQQIDLFLEFGRAREALDRADPQVTMASRDRAVMGSEMLLRRAACQFALGRLDETLATLGRMARPAPTRSLGARALELEGRTRIARGEYAQARAVLEAARDIAFGAGLGDLSEALDAKIGVVMLYQGDYTGSLGRLEEALKHWRERGRTREVADLLGHIGMVHAARNNATEALACYSEALELAEARGIRSERERWSGALGVLMTDLGDYDSAQLKLNEALDIAREIGNRQGEATWRGELGIHHLHAGRPEQASQELTRCLAIAREIGFARYEAWAQLYLGVLSLDRDFDRLDDARQWIEAGLEIAQDLGNEELRIVGLLHLSRLRRAEGDLARARETLERADLLARASQNLRLRARVRAELT